MFACEFGILILLIAHHDPYKMIALPVYSTNHAVCYVMQCAQSAVAIHFCCCFDVLAVYTWIPEAQFENVKYPFVMHNDVGIKLINKTVSSLFSSHVPFSLLPPLFPILFSLSSPLHPPPLSLSFPPAPLLLLFSRVSCLLSLSTIVSSHSQLTLWVS